ncbi:interleukin-17D isoform X1 [Cervus canadensis]|uniref:interleukin-17D isoform X1 n=1 Tax=Cervus canadensis TaxID=1574408 RepID=UPI001C9E2F77|nr:interleukin-17D isoform X1 [Cervus canadensis]
MWKLVVLGKVTVSKVGSEEQGWDIQVLTEETAEEEVLTFTGGKEFWSALTQEGRRGETGCLQARALLSRCPSSRGSSRAAGPADFPSSRGASFRSRRAARLRSDVSAPPRPPEPLRGDAGAASLGVGGRCPAGAVAGPGGGRPEGGPAASTGAGLRGPARGAPGAAVRATGGRRARRLPPHAAAGPARAGAQRQLPGRGQARRPPLPAAHQPAQRVALGLQDLLRPRPLPAVPARGLLPVPGLPDRATWGGGCAPAQRPSARARGGPAPDPRLRGWSRCLRRGVRHCARGLHLRARAGEGCGCRQLQPGQVGPALTAHPGPRARGNVPSGGLDQTGLDRVVGRPEGDGD